MLCPFLKKMRFKMCLAGFVQGRYLTEKVKLCEKLLKRSRFVDKYFCHF